MGRAIPYSTNGAMMWNLRGWERLSAHDDPPLVVARQEFLTWLAEVPEPFQISWKQRLESKVGRNNMGVNDIASGACCCYQDPRAIRYVGAYDKTYWGYVTKNGNIKINSYSSREVEPTHRN
ncbi:hypothetical protein ACFLTP_01625 [Chloroflexota bacterium]